MGDDHLAHSIAPTLKGVLAVPGLNLIHEPNISGRTDALSLGPPTDFLPSPDSASVLTVWKTVWKDAIIGQSGRSDSRICADYRRKQRPPDVIHWRPGLPSYGRSYPWGMNRVQASKATRVASNAVPRQISFV